MKKNSNLPEELTQRIRSVVGNHGRDVPLHEPEFLGREREFLLDCINTRWVSSVGSYVDTFETEIARHTGCAFGVAVSNGTAALQLALKVGEVKINEEVLMPALTFVATANAASYLGAVPHFVDSCYNTLGVCPQRLRSHLEQIAEVREGKTWNRVTGRRIAAIVPVHLFGCPVDIDGLDTIVTDWPMIVVEDAAESLGSSFKGRVCGSLGTVAAFSFNGNKIITTGGGGAVVTNNAKLAKLAKHLSTTAKQAHSWEFVHDQLGYNYRMPNLNAALGVAQLEQLNERLRLKQRLFEKYQKTFQGLTGGKLFSPPDGFNSNNWLVTFILEREYREDRDRVLQVLNDGGIHSRPAWRLMHHLPMYQSVPRADLSQAEDLQSRLINIPSSAYLGL